MHAKAHTYPNGTKCLAYTYYMSPFRIPSGIANLMEKKMRESLRESVSGDHGTHSVAWEKVVGPKEMGGLANGGGDYQMKGIPCGLE